MTSAGASISMPTPSLPPSLRSIFSSSSDSSESADVPASSNHAVDSSASNHDDSEDLDKDVDNTDDDDQQLPSDRSSIQDAIARVKKKIERIEDGTEDELMLGCSLRLAHKYTHVARAHDNFDRFKRSALELYEYECAQAKARYRTRCAQLQQDMADDIEREIQRLQNARDGVSVMDRRRLTRTSGRAAEPKARGSGSGSTRKSDRKSDAQDDKKRLDALLSKAPVFAPLQTQLDGTDAASDVDAIAHAVQQRSGAPRERVLDSNWRVAFPQNQQMSPKNQKDQQQQRRSLFDLDDHDHDASDSSDSDSNEHEYAEHLRRINSQRLAYNPAMLQEGDRVAVYRRAHCNSDDNDGSDAVAPAEHVLTGVITAATATHVFLLCADGAFETIRVRDWTTGRVHVHALTKH